MWSQQTGRLFITDTHTHTLLVCQRLDRHCPFVSCQLLFPSSLVMCVCVCLRVCVCVCVCVFVCVLCVCVYLWIFPAICLLIAQFTAQAQLELAQHEQTFEV